MAKPAPTVADDGTAVPAETPPQELGPVFKRLAGPAKWADERLGLATLVRNDGKKAFYLRKVFPDHWSFLLGEIALYSFIVLLLTGVFLTIWFKPSMGELEYQGPYQLLRGTEVSEAYDSTLFISFQVRGGLLLRQAHHWAAMLFVAAMLVHSLRIFFTGAFRKPRELNWLIGVSLIAIGLIEGFAGYSLPDDLLSGTGLRFVDGLIRGIPLIGTWAEFFVFGGEFPGSLIIPRLYMVHILLVPAIILGLVAAHLALVFYHKHTQYPGPGRNENNVVGYPLYPGLHGQGRRLLLHRHRRHPADGRAAADQPGLGVRPVQPGRGDRGVPARLVHGLRRGRHPDHAELGVPLGPHHVVVERGDPRPRTDGADVHRDGSLSVHRAVGDR